MHKYLFIVSINNSGSSKLAYELGRCEHVSLLKNVEGSSLYEAMPSLGPHGSREGLSRVLTEKLEVFANPDCYDWKEIKKMWLSMWDLVKEVLVQKSPVYDILVFDQVVKYFSPLDCIFLVRDPYAVVEGCRRQCAYHGYKYSIERCAKHVMKCMSLLLDAYVNPKGDVQKLLVRYEDLCDKSAEEIDKIRRFQPLLSDFVAQGWENRNASHMIRLGKEGEKTCTKVFEQYDDVMKFFKWSYK